MDVIFIKAAQLVLALMILIIIHEFGHFIFARIFGMKVDKFYIFFNPKFSLFKWKPRKYLGSMERIHCLSDEGKREYELESAVAVAESEWGDAQGKQDRIEKTIKKIKRFEWLDSMLGKSRSAEIPALEAKLEEARKATAVARKKFDEAYDKKMEYDCADYERAQKTSWLSRIWKNTTYGIGWLPLGGYCKISGMIDESMDTEQMKRPAQPWEFRSKPAWQRLLVMIAGVLFNFLTAIVIYAGIVYATGEKYVNFNEAKLGMAYSDVAKKIGFQDGDIPIEADGEVLTNPADGRMKMAQAKTVKVLRDGRDTVSIAIPDGFIFQLDEEMKNGAGNINFMAYRIPTSVSQVAPGGGADKGGMKVGDRVLAINDTVIPSLDVFFKTIDGQKDKDLKFTVLRNGKDTIPLTVHTDGNAKIGIGLDTDPSSFFKAEVKSYNLFQSVPRGIEMGVDQLSSYASSMKLVFTKEGAKSIGGFGTIGSIFPEKWNWLAFWNIAAFLSVALAFMNILPIPALDGGHVFFLLYEIIFRRKPSERFMETAQMIGIFLLFALLIYANGMDIVRLFIK